MSGPRCPKSKVHPMAGLKKPSRRKETTSPNVVLVIFLVFFVLLSIGLGVWGYYGYAGQEKLAAEAKNAKKDKEAAKTGEEGAIAVRDMEHRALGYPLPEDEMTLSRELIKAYTDDNNQKFKSEKLRDE